MPQQRSSGLVTVGSTKRTRSLPSMAPLAPAPIDTSSSAAPPPAAPTPTPTPVSGATRHRPGSSSSRRRTHRSSNASSSSSSSSSSSLSSRRTSLKHLRPSKALIQRDSISVAECVREMIQAKTDAALLVDPEGLLTGILTDRDIAFKVVAVGKNPLTTCVADVMTPNPSCVASHESAIDALKKMVSGQFRHLPVTDHENKVVGILDIAKCLYEAITRIERAYDASSKSLSNAVKKLGRHMAGSSRENLLKTLRDKLFLPTLSVILAEGSAVPIVSPTASTLEAAKLMLEKRISAVMVCEPASNQMVGIFTSKDLMRRVVGLDFNPAACLLSAVMTPNPYSATLSTTILDTLHSMHNGKFLHVPVFNDDGTLVGLVDVLQVTCGIVQQMGTFQHVRNDTTQPLWDSSRNTNAEEEESGEEHEEADASSAGSKSTELQATVAEEDTNDSDPDEATTSNLNSLHLYPSHRHTWPNIQLQAAEMRLVGQMLQDNPMTQTDGIDKAANQTTRSDANSLTSSQQSTLPALQRRPSIPFEFTDPLLQENPLHDSSSTDPAQESSPNAFVFKLADRYGTNHRFTSSADSISELMRDVQNRLGDYTIRKLHYVDEEGDRVLLFKDDDLRLAVERAKMWGNKYVRLIVQYRLSSFRDRGAARAYRHGHETAYDNAFGIVYYAAAAAAIAGASFFLSRRR